MAYQFQARNRRRRHRARHLGYARPLDERDRPQGHRGALRDRREGRRRRGDQGRGDHIRQGDVLRRRRPHHAGKARREFAEARQGQGRGSGRGALFEESRKLSLLYRRLETCGKPWVAAINGTALGGGFELPRLPPPRRGGQPEDARRPAGGQGRPVSRRRRHAAHRAHDAAGRRAAVPAQGRQLGSTRAKA